MGFHTFRNDPKSYLNAHTMSIGQNAAAFPPLTAAADVAVPGGGTKRQYTHNTGQFVDMVYQFGHHAGLQVAAEKTKGYKAQRAFGLKPHVSPVMRYAAPVASPADTGLRFLPYELGYVTHMALDAGATFAITGPLTGCTIGVAQTPAGGIHFLHSFTPNGFLGDAARVRQAHMIDNVRVQLGLVNLHTAINTIDYDGQAFVFGRISHGHWKFYAYGLLSGLRKICEF